MEVSKERRRVTESEGEREGMREEDVHTLGMADEHVKAQRERYKERERVRVRERERECV